MLNLHLLPADQGDAIWIEYESRGRTHRVLIDAGTPRTAEKVRRRMNDLPPSERRFDLWVITHVDTDHIGGALKLLTDLPDGIEFDDIWFNGPRQLFSVMGPIDGEIFGEAVSKRGIAFNKMFDGRSIVVPPSGELPEKTLRGGMKMTVLSPEKAQLDTLREHWLDVLEEERLLPGSATRAAGLKAKARRKGVSSILGAPTVKQLAGAPFESDDTIANGSSIALLAELGEKSVILGADAYAPVLASSTRRLIAQRGLKKTLRTDAFKLPHHGSRRNLSADLLGLLSCERYLFSTSGSSFGHPDDEAIARVVMAKSRKEKRLFFNYPPKTIAANFLKKHKSKRPVATWKRLAWADEFNYSVEYAPDDDAGITVTL